MKKFKPFFRFLTSMQFAVILLVILAAACMAGSFITQGQTYAWYAARYSERAAAVIYALRLDDAFHSWWFILITAFLCLNLAGCSIARLPQLILRWRASGQISGGETAALKAEHVRDPQAFFKALGMPAAVSGTVREAASGEAGAGTGTGSKTLVSSRNRAGLFGPWICHLGILLLILGFGLGQMTKEDYTVYGVPGQTRPIGETPYTLTIDDFRIGLRNDDTVEQYTADITVSEKDGDKTESASVSVNAPAKMFGMSFIQNSTGWAARVRVTKDGEPLQEETLCAGEYLAVADKPELVVYFNAFYPDFVMTDGGPATASSEIRNPAYLYTVYYQGNILGMNALKQDEELTIDEYAVTFGDPQNYTLIQVKRDRFIPLAFLGGLLTAFGLFLSFYVLPVKVWAVKENADEEPYWTVYASCPKGGVLFREKFLKTAENGKNA